MMFRLRSSAPASWLSSTCKALPTCTGTGSSRTTHGKRHVRKLSLSVGRSQNRSWISGRDRKSTRLNSSHTVISYAVFCLKKKKKKKKKQKIRNELKKAKKRGSL